VASVQSEKDSEVELMAFASNGTQNPDAFILLNRGQADKEVAIEVAGSKSGFSATRSSETEQHVALGDFKVSGGTLVYKAPAGSVSTFVAK
jgi:hypothetical protein